MSAINRVPRYKAVHQLLPSFSPRDAIGNETVLIQKLVRDAGLRSEIYAEQGTADTVATLLKQGGDALVLYHFSIASSIPGHIAALRMPKIVRYHSITPPWFFSPEGGELPARQACSLGQRQIPLVATIADDILAASAYNAAEIAPFTEIKPQIIPVLRDYAQLSAVASGERVLPPSPKMTLLFVGRIAPNKCQHDLIMLLHLAKKFLTPQLRLVLIGGFFSAEFHRQFIELARHLQLSVGTDPQRDAEADILLPTNVSDAVMAGYYREARVFVSLSEHEGFGVPLVEAMHFDLPILAHAVTAVPETVGEAGLLIDKNDWPQTVAALKALLFDEPLRASLLPAMARQRERLGLRASAALMTAALDRWLYPAP